MRVKFFDLQAQYREIRKPVEKAVAKVCWSQEFILGDSVSKFETEFRSFINPHGYALGVSSGTDALLLALMALGIGPGDEVITTPYTFVATANVIARLGAKPVFVDIDPKTYNIDPTKIKQAITKKTKAIIPVHLFGLPADMLEILEIARRRALYVVEDAAQAFGSKYKNEAVGRYSDIAAFSFFPSKNLGGFGDGGAVYTENPFLFDKLRALRVHGATSKYYHQFVGGNFRLDVLQAVILAVKLKYVKKWFDLRMANALLYQDLLHYRFHTAGYNCPGLSPVDVSQVPNQYVVTIRNRDAVKAYLKNKGIETAVYYPTPLHLQPCFEYLGYKPGDFQHAEFLAKTALALPIYPELSETKIRYVAKTLLEAVDKCAG